MKSLLCKLFGHKVVGLNTRRFFAWCDRCNKGLKCSYDMSYGDTLIVGDYGTQRTFCWCDCGNELCSEGKLISDTYEYGVEYKCSKCGQISNWCFDAPLPYRIKDSIIEEEHKTKAQALIRQTLDPISSNER